jgi:hypothetical protein
MATAPGVVAWTHVEGTGASRVVVYEDMARGGMLTLRWWNPARKNWRRNALGRTLVRDRRGRLEESSTAWAIQEARRKSVALGDGLDEPAPGVPVRAFTVGQTEAAITDEETGKYPHPSPMRAELVRALRAAVQVWGSDTPWHAVDDGAWVRLIRRRLDGLLRQGKQGVRTTEITVARIATATRWLRRNKKIAADVGHAPEDWKQEILTSWRGLTGATRDPVPFRPRHTLEELRQLLDSCWFVDPRLGLLVAIGAEYRLGQIVRAMRSDLDVQARTFVVHGQGKKGGETIDLTDGQMRAVFTALGGYLDDCEDRYLADGTDYPLFPSGRLVRRAQLPGHRQTRDTERLGRRRRGRVHLTTTWIIRNFHLAEDAAGIDRVRLRGAYGLRRQNVDAANARGISPQGLQATGGWSSPKIPNEVYAEQTNRRGRDEAKRVRALTRGES